MAHQESTMNSVNEKFLENRNIIESFRPTIDKIELDCINVVTQTKINENRITEIGSSFSKLESVVYAMKLEIQNIKEKELDQIRNFSLNAEK